MPQIDQQLRHLDGAAVAFQHRHLPAHLVQPLLQMRAHPERRRAAKDDDLRAIVLDRGDGFGDRALQHLRPLAAFRLRLLCLDRPRLGIGRPRQRTVDVADRGAFRGEAILHHQIVVVHVVRFGDVDDAEPVAEHRRDVHLRQRAAGDRDVVALADLARLGHAGIAAAQQHDRVVAAALAGLAHDRQARRADDGEFLARLDIAIRPVARSDRMQVPLHIRQQRRDIGMVHQLRFLRSAGPDANSGARFPAA